MAKLKILIIFVILAMATEASSENIQEKGNFSPPKVIKTVYLTSWSAGRKSKIDYVINLAKTTEINAVVIDIKDFSGYVAYDTDDSIAPKVKEYKAKQKRISDVTALIEKLHKEGIYVIGRIVVFQDPVLAKARQDLAIRSKYDKLSFFSPRSLIAAISVWLDNLKLAWVDPSSKEVWDYNIAIAKDAQSRGFDEINFDYLRFPSDGDLKNMLFPLWDGKTPRNLVIRNFFERLREELPDAVLSVDIFGLATLSYNDLGVGQIIEDAFEYFDYISPMVYPSHYAKGFLGYENPAKHPYEVVKYSMDSALWRLKNYESGQNTKYPEGVASRPYGAGKIQNPQLRPWLQDFNLGARYDKELVKAEIKAVSEALTGDNFNGFMLWNSWNFYTKEALAPENY